VHHRDPAGIIDVSAELGEKRTVPRPVSRLQRLDGVDDEGGALREVRSGRQHVIDRVLAVRLLDDGFRVASTTVAFAPPRVRIALTASAERTVVR